MRHPMKDLPLIEDYGENFRSRLVEWGGMIVSYEIFPRGVDATPLFKGLPDGMCQSPHWGYILKGRVRVIASEGGSPWADAGRLRRWQDGEVVDLGAGIHSRRA
jgi:hypothetical protein